MHRKASYTLALVLSQMHQWTLRLIVSLVKLQAPLFDCMEEFGITPSYLSAQSRLSIVPMFAVLYCTAEKPGPFHARDEK